LGVYCCHDDLFAIDIESRVPLTGADVSGIGIAHPDLGLGLNALRGTIALLDLWVVAIDLDQHGIVDQSISLAKASMTVLDREFGPASRPIWRHGLQSGWTVRLDSSDRFRSITALWRDNQFALTPCR